MQVVHGNNLTELYRKLLTAVLFNGEKVEVRGTESMELHPCMSVLTDPSKRTLLFPGRDNNPFATLFETVWVLTGSNNIEHLSHFLPRASDFSDDGKTWRAGYGARIMRDPVDQLHSVYRLLKEKDLYSRQAVISLWRPDTDGDVDLKSLDRPCTGTITFLVRDGQLDCTVVMRSNDLYWGFSSVNVYEFTVMQEILAKLLGIPLGTYYHFANSLHLYTKGYNAETNLPKIMQSMDNTSVEDTAYNEKNLRIMGMKQFEFPIADDGFYQSTIAMYQDVYDAFGDRLSYPMIYGCDSAKDCLQFLKRAPICGNGNFAGIRILFNLHFMYQKFKTKEAFSEFPAFFTNLCLNHELLRSVGLLNTDLFLSCAYWINNKLKKRSSFESLFASIGLEETL